MMWPSPPHFFVSLTSCVADFSPLSVFYCYDSDGVLRHAVAEVRNTYGGWHSYLLQLDESGSASVGNRSSTVSP